MKEIPTLVYPPIIPILNSNNIIRMYETITEITIQESVPTLIVKAIDMDIPDMLIGIVVANRFFFRPKKKSNNCID